MTALQWTLTQNSTCYLFRDGGSYHKETNLLICNAKSLDWFLYDRDLHHERANLGFILLTWHVFVWHESDLPRHLRKTLTDE